MDWKQEAKRLFKVPKPTHFTNYWHCSECAEHDETLVTADVDAIGLRQLKKLGRQTELEQRFPQLLAGFHVLFRSSDRLIFTPFRENEERE
jgi:hypothetical protein